MVVVANEMKRQKMMKEGKENLKGRKVLVQRILLRLSCVGMLIMQKSLELIENVSENYHYSEHFSNSE